MRQWAILLGSLAITACSKEAPGSAQPTASPMAVQTPAVSVAPAATALPADVAAFKVKRDGCDELRGEEPYDKARAAQLARDMKTVCTGTDKALAALQAKYAGNVVVAAALADYEPTVE